MPYLRSYRVFICHAGTTVMTIGESLRFLMNHRISDGKSKCTGTQPGNWGGISRPSYATKCDLPMYFLSSQVCTRRGEIG